MTIQVDDFDVNDFIIRMKPNFDTGGAWNGFIDLDIITDNKRTMAQKDYLKIMQVASLVCSSLPLMELDENFRDTLCNYVEDMIKEEDRQDRKDVVKESVSNATGNIIKVNFSKGGSHG